VVGIALVAWAASRPAGEVAKTAVEKPA